MRRVSIAPEPVSETVVMKFGGPALADIESVKSVAERLTAARERGLRVVATVSALGPTTDSLIELARRISPDPDARELDMLLSTGERVACALVAMAINDRGHEAVSFTGSQAGILTDAIYNEATIREITPVRVVEALDAGKIVLVAGFQGFARETMDVTTLGQGGTDATAVALAAALNAACEIYSETAGVFTADPEIVPEARKLGAVSYEEMLEMAASGANVVMVRAVELARSHGVRIHARSAFSDEPGTWIDQAPCTDATIVTAVTHSKDEVVFVLSGILDHAESAAAIFDAAAMEHVKVGTFLQDVSRGKTDLLFSVAREDGPAARRALERARKAIGTIGAAEIGDVGTVSLVGIGMRSQPGVAARMFRTLAAAEIDPLLVSTAPITISCTIGRDEVRPAVRALHAAFDLAGSCLGPEGSATSPGQ
jgi:aspartate kinase